MDTAKKTRGRSKSVNPNEENENSVDASANLNGENAKMVEKQDDTKGDKLDKDSEKPAGKDEDKTDTSKEKTKSRKRKASEMKSGDENNPEEVSKDLKEKEGVVDKPKESVDSNKSSKDSDKKKDKDVKEDIDALKVSDVEMKAADDDKVEPPKENSTSDLDLPPKQMLGKGKRARIPNKRYSDILLAPSSKIMSPRVMLENGDKRIMEKLEAEEGEEKNHPTVTSIKARTSSDSPVAKKPKLSIDLSNPNYLKPFKLGWKRELVYRATNDSASKRNGDIYYYTPGGKKVRSMREVGEHLDISSGLRLEDFTFFKEPLGLDDPEKETIRDAKIKLGGSTGGGSFMKKSSTPKLTKTPKPKVSVTPSKSTPVTPKTHVSPTHKPAAIKTTPAAKTTSVPKASTTTKDTVRVASPPHVSSETPVSEPVANKTKSVAKLGNFKIKPPAKKQDKKVTKAGDTSMEIEAGPSKWTPKKTGKWANPESKPCQPCSIRCPAMMGMVPTLQCRLCLCLYHHACVGMPADFISQNYVCKNCYLEQEKSNGNTSPPTVPPPPLTPINTLKSTTPLKSCVLPRLQRIPRPGDTSQPNPVMATSPARIPTPDVPRLMPRPLAAKLVKVSESFTSGLENKSLVGSVTTWLPQSSKIVDSQRSDLATTEAPRPQFVEYLAGRKFLIIPKHNIVSVSPAVAVTASVRTEDTVNIPESNRQPNDSASLGIKEASDIKPEPDSPSKPENTQTEAMDVDPPTETIPTPMEPEERQNETEKEPASKTTPSNRKRPAARSNNYVVQDNRPEDCKFMDNYFQHLAFGYNTMLYVFQYLKVQDLLHAGCVCTMWRDIASHPALWRTVRLKNSSVHSFEGMSNSLRKHGTVHLDLRKMLLPSAGEEMWPEFNKCISIVTSLRKIELCRCPASVIEQLAESNPDLEIVNAVAIKCETMNLDTMKNFTNLKELRLKSISGFSLTSDLDALEHLKSLKHLSLTSIRDLHKLNLKVIARLTKLESLDLGECMDFPKNFGSEILVKLPKLEKLRLEKGQGNCHTFEILDAVKDMPRIEQLELVNFDIKAGFDKALGNCTNIKRLLIIPTYISQSATTNHMVLGGVLRLQKTLSHFVWGVTLELLRVTELFVDQCEEPDKKDKSDREKHRDKEKKSAGNGDSIPVLKPVPLISDKETEIQPAFDPPQVEILPLPNLQKLLLQSLPTTRVKILKIPFHATWRQSITDSVN